jgi:hypothetical protein
LTPARWSYDMVVPYNYYPLQRRRRDRSGRAALAEAVPNEESRAAQGERMTGKVCMVTGGGSGIGRAAALKMAAEGAAAVLVAGRYEAEIESTFGPHLR